MELSYVDEQTAEHSASLSPHPPDKWLSVTPASETQLLHSSSCRVPAYPVPGSVPDAGAGVNKADPGLTL